MTIMPPTWTLKNGENAKFHEKYSTTTFKKEMFDGRAGNLSPF